MADVTAVTYSTVRVVRQRRKAIQHGTLPPPREMKGLSETAKWKGADKGKSPPIMCGNGGTGVHNNDQNQTRSKSNVVGELDTPRVVVEARTMLLEVSILP